jgi:hypothetical protein
MGSFSDYLENELLDHAFKTGAYTPATHLYIALSKSTLDDTVTGTIAGELSGGAYARTVCDTWDAASAGATENTQVVTFAQATADWGTVTNFAIIDAITAGTGNVLAYGALTAAKLVESGDTLKFATGDIDITLA